MSRRAGLWGGLYTLMGLKHVTNPGLLSANDTGLDCGAQKVEVNDPALKARAYSSQYFSLRSVGREVKTPQFMLGLCATPRGNHTDGRKVDIRDIVEHIPNVTFFSDYPAYQK